MAGRPGIPNGMNILQQQQAFMNESAFGGGNGGGGSSGNFGPNYAGYTYATTTAPNQPQQQPQQATIVQTAVPMQQVQMQYAPLPPGTYTTTAAGQPPPQQAYYVPQGQTVQYFQTTAPGQPQPVVVQMVAPQQIQAQPVQQYQQQQPQQQQGPLKVKIKLNQEQQQQQQQPTVIAPSYISSGSQIVSSQPITQQDDQNLRIVIKKSDIAGVRVDKFPFPNIDANSLSTLERALKQGSPFFDKWSHIDHLPLRAEIQSIQTRLKAFHDLLTSQIASIETWRDSTFDTHTPMPPSQSASNSTAAAAQNKAKRDVKKKAVTNTDYYFGKGKKDDDFSDEDLDSMELDDADRKKDKLKTPKERKRTGPVPKKDTPKPAKATPTTVVQSAQPLPMPSAPSTPAPQPTYVQTAQPTPIQAAGGQTPMVPTTPIVPATPVVPAIPAPTPESESKAEKGNKLKRKKKKKGDEDYSSGEELKETAPSKGPKIAKHPFWIEVDHYFTNFTDEHLKFATPVQLDRDPIMTIPPLGRNYKDIWEEADRESGAGGTVPQLPTQTQTQPQDEDTSSKPIGVLDFTARLLSALVEEKIISPSDPTKQPKLPATEQMQSIEAPPLYDYSYDGMLNLEQRIKLELHSVGLLREDELEITNVVDDELSAEIRNLQSQLREQVKVTNQLRVSKLFPGVQNAIQKEQPETKQKLSAWLKTKDAYMKVVKKKKPRKNAAEKAEKA